MLANCFAKGHASGWLGQHNNAELTGSIKLSVAFSNNHLSTAPLHRWLLKWERTLLRWCGCTNRMCWSWRAREGVSGAEGKGIFINNSSQSATSWLWVDWTFFVTSGHVARPDHKKESPDLIVCGGWFSEGCFFCKVWRLFLIWLVLAWFCVL